MQKKLESNWVGRLLISVLVAVTVGAMVVWNLPGSKLRAEGMRLAGPYVRAVGLDQNWSVFAPDPYRETFWLYARITYADGTTGRWPVPEGGDAIGAYWDFRWGKWAEWVIAGSHPDLCKGTATYVANREADEGRTPVQIDLVRRRRINSRPGQEPSHGSWEESEICTSDVVPSGGHAVRGPAGTVRAAAASWDRFWFAPQSVATLAVVRIAFALVVLAWTAALGRDLFAFYSGTGLLPEQQDVHQVVGPGAWGPLGTFTSDTALVVTYVALFVAALLLLVGLKTRIAAVVVFVCLMALTRRNVWVLDSGDPLLRSIAFFLALAPSGDALSLDRRLAVRRGRQLPAFPLRAPWALRLLQLQLSVLYLSAVWAKVAGETWRDGTAVSYVLRIENLQRFPLPDALTTSELVSNVLTFGTLAVELSLGLLVWNRKLRPWILLAGVSLHLGIDYAIRVGFFSYAVLVLYIAFIPPETMERWLFALRSRLARARGRPAAAPGTADSS